jgi:receptor expression-enhancing protein 5/6
MNISDEKSINKPKVKENIHNKKISDKKKKLTAFEIIEKKTDLPVSYVLSALGIAGGLIFLGYMEMQLTNLVAIVFPIYWTMRSIEKPEKYDEAQWLTYWGLFFFSLFFDWLMPRILIRIPYFYFAKFLFFTWLFMPNTLGALYLHNRFFQKIFGPIDIKVRGITDKIKSKINYITDKLTYISPQAEKYEEEEEQPVHTREQTQESQGIITNQKQDQNVQEEYSREGQKYSQPKDKDILKPVSEQNVPIPKETKEQQFTQEQQHETAEQKIEKPQEHESRQNISGDAKLPTESWKTGMQNIQNEISDTVDKLKQHINEVETQNQEENIDKSQQQKEQPQTQQPEETQIQEPQQFQKETQQTQTQEPRQPQIQKEEEQPQKQISQQQPSQQKQPQQNVDKNIYSQSLIRENAKKIM